MLLRVQSVTKGTVLRSLKCYIYTLIQRAWCVTILQLQNFDCMHMVLFYSVYTVLQKIQCIINISVTNCLVCCKLYNNRNLLFLGTMNRVTRRFLLRVCVVKCGD